MSIQTGGINGVGANNLQPHNDVPETYTARRDAVWANTGRRIEGSCMGMFCAVAIIIASGIAFIVGCGILIFGGPTWLGVTLMVSSLAMACFGLIKMALDSVNFLDASLQGVFTPLIAVSTQDTRNAVARQNVGFIQGVSLFLQ